MSRMPLTIFIGAGALALVAAAPCAFALAQAQGSSQVAVPTYTRQEQKSTNLPTMTVYGHRLPFPVQLQLYKKALTRSWSNSRADRHKLVCRWNTPTGSRLQYLRCQTNLAHEREVRRTQIALITADAEYSGGVRAALNNGTIPVELAAGTAQNQISRSALAPLLKKLPKADASYTLRVTGDNGKPILDYVVKDGELAHVYHYVYKPKTKSGTH